MTSSTVIIRSPIKRRWDSDDLYRIPKHCTLVFANGLKVKEGAEETLKTITEDVRDIFSTGITPDNYVRFFHYLLWYEETIMRINLKHYNMSGVHLDCYDEDYVSLFVPGLAEKRPSLMPSDRLFIRPCGTDIFFEAVVSNISNSKARLRGLDSRFWKHCTKNALFDVRFVMSRTPLERMHRALEEMEDHKSILFPVKNKHSPQIAPLFEYFNPLVQANPEQRQAVEHIVAGAAGAAPYLLHGPPGTGKTHTIVEAILQLVNKNRLNRIMVCTDSNMAADHVATTLVQYSHLFDDAKTLLLRANSKFRSWETLPECLFEHSNGTPDGGYEDVSPEKFQSFRIVVTTLSHAAKFVSQFRKARASMPISHLFIDEAAQASEPSSLVPLALLRGGGRLVLAGDPHQLGPVVVSESAKALGLGLSLMERLTKTCPLYSNNKMDPNYTVMLLSNFRSNADIIHIPNKLFYNGQLRACASKDKLSETDISGERAESRAIVFHGVLSSEQKDGKSPSVYNEMEIEVVQMYVMLLISDHHLPPEDIGIVTPYARQVYKIRKWLVDNDLKVEVGSVEAFQGKEKRVIIISTVRGSYDDAKSQLGFLVDYKRFNVALTRARAKAIVIGNPACLSGDAKWKAYIEMCKAFGTYFGYDPPRRSTLSN